MTLTQPRGLNGDPVFHAEDVPVGKIPGAEFGYKRDLTVTVSVRMEELTRQETYETVEHERVSRPLDFAITLGVWQPSTHYLVSSGRDAALLTDVYRYAEGFGPATVAELTDLLRYHLNAMKPGCVHQQPNAGLDSPACPETGYRWGSAWLVQELPDNFLDIVKAVFQGADRSKIWMAAANL